jgi:hypothetical protein
MLKKIPRFYIYSKQYKEQLKLEFFNSVYSLSENEHYYQAVEGEKQPKEVFQNQRKFL